HDAGIRQQRLRQDREKAQGIHPDQFLQFLDHWYQQPMLAQQVPADEESRRSWYARRSRNHPPAIAACLEGFSPGGAPDFSDRVSQLTCPTLLLSGQQDPAYDNHYKQIVESLPNGCHISLSGC